MKHYILLLSALLCSAINYGQCETPPPPGASTFYSLDPDNDGFTEFDLAWFIDQNLRPGEEMQYGVTSAGYDFIYHNNAGDAPASPYTNVEANEFGIVDYTYNGAGPEFQPQPPCFWPPQLFAGVYLVAVPFDGDMDNDGILNSDEDANHNLNLMDDDSDNDGTINLWDASTLATAGFDNAAIRVYPNPVRDGYISIDSKAPIASVAIMDCMGKLLIQRTNPEKVDVRMLASGTYVMKIVTDGGEDFKRIVVE